MDNVPCTKEMFFMCPLGGLLNDYLAEDVI
jgi:hypothetical protein